MIKVNPSISVIIPAYNSQETIINCLNSVLKSRVCIEVIVVNDASTDNTKSLIEEYTKEVIVINNDNNKGAGYSRNRGVEKAQGDYICFIDSDDCVDENYLDCLYETAKKNDSEVVVCDICSVSQKMTNNNFNFNNVIDLMKKPLIASPCGKLIKKEYLKKYPFPVGIINEDIATIVPIVASANNINYESRVKYYYIQHNNSVQNIKFSIKKFDLFKSIDIVNERLKDINNNHEIIEILIFNQIILFLIYMIIEIKDYSFRYKCLNRYIKELDGRYNIKKNKYFNEYIADKGKQNIIFYKLLIWFISKKYAGLANNLISCYNLARKMRTRFSVIPNNITDNKLLELAIAQSKLPMNKYTISVVIPNYNYAEFLYQRVYSILNQKKRVDQIILLDDYSTDQSKLVIEKIRETIGDHVNLKVVYNLQNSGCVFEQWRKGFELSDTDYVWVAEADDFCNNKFLYELFKVIEKDSNIVLAYSNTKYINKIGNIINNRVKELIDIKKTGHWNNSYINEGLNEIVNYAYLNCTIANVSSVVFKNNNYSNFLKEATNYKQAGDWYFYLQVMSTGKVAYIDKCCNYYRIHGENQTSNTKKVNYLKEIANIHKWVCNNYELSNDKLEHVRERDDYLRQEWGLDK